jgi:hypothetical protein
VGEDSVADSRTAEVEDMGADSGADSKCLCLG